MDYELIKQTDEITVGTEEEAKAKFEFAYTEIINKVKEVFEADETPEEDESFLESSIRLGSS